MKKILLLIITLSTTFGFSQNVFNDNFASYTAGQDLSGQGTWTNNSSTGFAGSGGCTGFGCLNSKVAAQTVSFTDYGLSSKSQTLTPNSDGCGTFFPVFSSTETIFVGMVIRIATASSAPIDFFRVRNGNAFTTAFRLIVKAGSSGFTIGIRKADTNNVTVYTSAEYAYNSSHLVVLKYTQNAGANDDELRLFVDPAYLAGEPAMASAASLSPNTVGTDQSGTIDRLGFSQNAGPAGMPTGFAGLVSVAKTWEDLSFIPLATTQFTKSTFDIVGTNAGSGILNIKSSLNLDKATLNIYDLQGRLIENKTISLIENANNIAINPIQNRGIYIVEIASGENKIAAKINVE